MRAGDIDRDAAEWERIMAGKKKKFYVVWKGHNPGIYTSWAECNAQVKGVPQAEYKSFETLAEAEQAYQGKYSVYAGKSGKTQKDNILPEDVLRRIGQPNPDAYCVDAACSGSPGELEYRCVHVGTRKEIFRQGPYADGTNNIGEFLALVHALALFKREGLTKPIYSDSKIAIGWVEKRHCRTKLEKTERNQKLFDLIERAERWLIENHFENRLIKWETRVWGEIPADYGRK
ncbi:MAG: ribonuclease H family protein [Caldilineaceae bacterium]|nr:ribonuclease H family protein [Caldilineaceae bacterium]